MEDEVESVCSVDANGAADIVREYDQVDWVNLAVLEDVSNSDPDMDHAMMAARTSTSSTPGRWALTSPPATKMLIEESR